MYYVRLEETTMEKESNRKDLPPQNEEENCLEARLAKWRQEQYRVAEQVVVVDDDNSQDDSSSGIQNGHRYRVKPPNQYSDKLYGGVDVSFPEEEGNPAVAVYCIVRKDEVVYHDHETFDLTIPYVSSYLSFREIDPLERLVKKQIREHPELTPFAILVDGNGVLHERRAGIACFLGVRTGLKTIGVGKTLYCQAGLSTALVKNGIDRAVEELVRQTRVDPGFKAHLQTERGLILDNKCIDPTSTMAEEVVSMDRGAIFRKWLPSVTGFTSSLWEMMVGFGLVPCLAMGG